MDNIPLVPEKKKSTENENSENQRSSSQNVIPMDVAQVLIDEAANKAATAASSKVADEAASKAVSSYIQAAKIPPVDEGGLHVQDRRGAVLSYKELKDLERETEERIKREYGVGTVGGNRNTVSLGARFEDALNQKLNDEVIGSLVGNMFRGGGGVNPISDSNRTPPGMVGTILHELKGVLDTKFGYGLGEKVGTNITEVIKVLGQERIGQFIDNYNRGNDPNQQPQQLEQAQLTPEEQQKKGEAVIMGFDSTNVTDMTKFMEATGIKNLDAARSLLLSEQDRILQSRGLVRAKQQPSDESSTPAENQRSKPKGRQSDINRDLIDRYDNPDQYAPPVNTAPIGNDFFGGGGGQPNMGLQQSEEETILSLNPDDPTSIHIYAKMRNLNNLDSVTIKKTLMKEQKSLLDKLSNPVQGASQTNDSPLPVQDVQIEEHRGISPDEDQARLKGGSLHNEFLVESPVINQVSQSQQEKQQQISQTETKPLNPVSDTSNPMDTIMRILNKLDNKIDYLEDEIKILKSANEIKADDFTDIVSSEEQILTTKTVDIDTLINKSPKITSLNDVTKEDILIGNPIDVMNEMLLKDLNNTTKETKSEEEIESDISAISADVDKTGQENTKTNEKAEIDVPESQDKVETGKTKIEEIVIPNESKEGIDWWGERNKLGEEITDKTTKSEESENKEHRKFTIKKR